MFAIALLFLVAGAGKVKAAEISCEKVDNFGSFKKCCYFNATTTISAINTTVADLENSEVDAILFEYNKKIKFLPVNVYKKFPNLEIFLAKNASVKEISALNFDRLSSLKILDLRGNQIEFIPNFCFEGLIKLNEILLESNKIATMNGVAFANAPQLVIVNLRFNVCISNFFAPERAPNIFRRKISRNCASADAAKKEISCSASLACEESLNRILVDFFNRTLFCCKLEYGAYIESPDYSFIADANYNNIEAIYIIHQRNVEFLPVSVYERFPILKDYSVVNTPVQKISKKHFEKMYQLRILHLESNQIELIKSNTFEDLISLTVMNLLKQRLIALNGQAFANLVNLKSVLLRYNDCIDRDFFGDGIKTIASVVSNTCGYREFDYVEVPCEKFPVYDFYDYCLMNGKTAINATNFIVADLKDEELEGIIFERNTDIEYLPYKIYIQFPNLNTYKASRCSIKQIWRENFEKLYRLRSIELSFNLIQKISGNTFLGLTSLLRVDLNDNQIKSINGRTFDQIPLLTSVDLRLNECIDDMLEEGQSIKAFTRKIIQNCAFTETGEREFEKVFDIDCGVGLRGTGYVIGGNETKRGQWPFLAALIYEPQNLFFCGGNIITASHVLTAAHCIHDKKSEISLKASEIAILLGRYNISLRAELGSEIRGIKEIKVHPRWNPRETKFEGDLAVLELDRAVQFSELIQPICLTVEAKISQQEAGYVVGWGKSEALATHENVPRQVLTSSVSTAVCFSKNYKLGSIFAQGMFCAGGDGIGPCRGDSGGGYFVRYHGLWTLRGVVSSGSLTPDGGCDVGQYTLFSNVLKFAAWINMAVNKNATLTTWSSEKPPISGSEKIHSSDGSTEKPNEGSDVNFTGKRIFVRPEQYS